MMTLTELLKDQLDKEGAILDNARRDLKNARKALKVYKEYRKITSITIRDLKYKIKEADRAGNNSLSSTLRLTLALFREQYNASQEDSMMMKHQANMIMMYIKNQEELVLSADKYWEESKGEGQ